MTEEKIQFYRITDNYLDFLRKIDPSIQPNYPHRAKPHIGIMINIGIHKYFAPLSSYKDHKYDKIKNWNRTIYKVYGNKDKTEKLSVIHLNNMFPIIQSEIERMDFSQEEAKYKDLLEKEYSYIISNQTEIQKRAHELYESVTKGHSFYTSVSSNFSLLEKEYLKFNK